MENPMKITGTFEVILSPLDPFAEGRGGVNLRTMAIKKKFMGELEASSRGQMLSAMTSTPGSAGYVAMEQVSGSLCGRQGSFVLQHFGVMAEGSHHLTLEVVPGSGAEELVGLSGSMAIRIDEEGQHFYDFEFELDDL